MAGGHSAWPGRPQQRLAYPTRLRLADEAVLQPVQPTANDVLGGGLAARLHVLTVHPHRWRARKAGLLGSGLVDDQAGAQLGVDAELGPDPLRLCCIWLTGGMLTLPSLQSIRSPMPTR
jgi:hypothetical protein